MNSRRATAIDYAVAAAGSLAVLSTVGAPIPVYGVFQSRFGISETVISIGFAVYLLTCASGLLALKGLPHVIGAKKALLMGLILGLVTCAIFAIMWDAVTFITARALQGLACGVVIPASTAYLLGLGEPGARGRTGIVVGILPAAGTAVGSVVAASTSGEGTWVPFAALGAVIVVAVAFVALVSPASASSTRIRLSLRPTLAIPRGAGIAFSAVLLGIIAGFVFGGLYQTIAPGLLRIAFGQHDALYPALLLVAFIGSSVVSAPLSGLVRTYTALVSGLLGMAAGAVLVGTAVAVHDVIVLLLVSCIAGAGFGWTSASGVRLLLGLDHPAPGEVVGTLYFFAFIGNAVAILVTGLAGFTLLIHAFVELATIVVASVVAGFLIVLASRQDGSSNQ